VLSFENTPLLCEASLKTHAFRLDKESDALVGTEKYHSSIRRTSLPTKRARQDSNLQPLVPKVTRGRYRFAGLSAFLIGSWIENSSIRPRSTLSKFYELLQRIPAVL
jgi:hypothetical protein